MDAYQQMIHKSRYARYLPEKKRRETWEETVSRYCTFWLDRGLITQPEYDMLYEAIHNMDVMPSMRCLMTAGPALERDNVAGYNCSYLPIDHPRAFDELMFILLCGTGVGYSVERKYIKKLPEVAESFHETDTPIIVADSKVGWAKAFKQLVSLLYAGEIPKWDMSKVRPAGSVLKTFGGRASGPEPLDSLFQFTVNLFKGARGRQLSDLECSDLCCKIAEVVVVGGVRRSALIALTDPTSERMRDAKSGNFYDTHPERQLANISACYDSTPDFPFFYREMGALYDSHSGERGVFSRIAAQAVAGRSGRRDPDWDFGTNPCSEIILRPNQFCNLTEVVVRVEDTKEDLQKKVKLATILGTLQATLTDFRYLRKVWQTNTEEEALLGVSLTGIMDHPVLNSYVSDRNEWLEEMKYEAIATNKEWAARLGINPSAAITCVKPSGTVSQLVNSASGIHPRYSEYYIRRVRFDDKDPLASVLIEAGVPYEKAYMSPGTLVFSFPQKSPEGAITRDKCTALHQLADWMDFQDAWCEHKPSITVYYRDDDFLDICSWMWEHFDEMSGIALLPHDPTAYQQAPYEEITKEQYEEMLEGFPTEFNWDVVEESDVTEGSQELACVGGACEIS